MHPAAIFGICVGSYVVAAIFVVHVFPLAHSEAARRKKRTVKFPTQRVAHRGGSLNGPENTMWTFRRTARDIDVLELDVAITADGEVVVTHDAELARQCEAPGRIHEYESPKLPMLASTIPLHFPSSTHSSYSLEDDREKAESLGMCTERQPFALLSEVFEAFPTLPIHLDIKFTNAELVLKTLDLIDKYERRPLTIVGAASGQNVKDLRKEVNRRHQIAPSAPRFLTFSSFGEVVRTYLLYYSGLLPLIPIAFDCFSIPLMTKSKKNLFAQRHFANAFVRVAVVWMLKSPTLWRHLQRRGIVVLGFVLNDPQEWVEVEDWPINGVMTDDPLRYNRHLKTCRGYTCSCPSGHDPAAPNSDINTKTNTGTTPWSPAPTTTTTTNTTSATGITNNRSGGYGGTSPTRRTTQSPLTSPSL